MDYSKNVPNKCNHCKYYTNKDIWGFVPGRCSDDIFIGRRKIND